MPLYVYECSCGGTTETIRKVEERHDLMLCEHCGKPTRLQVQVAAFDPRMGLDPSFPTMQDKWAKARTKAAKGK